MFPTRSFASLDWGSLNFEKSDYSQVIEVLHRVEKEDIIYCLREFSKIFGEPSDSSASGSSMQSHATYASMHPQPLQHPQAKGAHALRPALKIRKHADHGNHRQLPGTPSTPFNSNGRAPHTPKEKLLPEISMDVNLGPPSLDSLGASLFDPEQPVDALCEQVVFLPKTDLADDIKAETDHLSMLYDSFESPGGLSGCRVDNDSRLGPGETTAIDMLDGVW